MENALLMNSGLSRKAEPTFLNPVVLSDCSQVLDSYFSIVGVSHFLFNYSSSYHSIGVEEHSSWNEP